MNASKTVFTKGMLVLKSKDDNIAIECGPGKRVLLPAETDFSACGAAINAVVSRDTFTSPLIKNGSTISIDTAADQTITGKLTLGGALVAELADQTSATVQNVYAATSESTSTFSVFEHSIDGASFDYMFEISLLASASSSMSAYKMTATVHSHGSSVNFHTQIHHEAVALAFVCDIYGGKLRLRCSPLAAVLTRYHVCVVVHSVANT